ncbi:MAG: AAA family ATPase [Acidobacteria bacterium]|nr:AAA family ATPase [Acidobacteriota bacterium]
MYTLVGLNESGKTTILEAMAFFESRIRNVDPISQPGFSKNDLHRLIPRHKSGIFNGSIKIEVGYELDPDDKSKIKEFLANDLGFYLDREMNDTFVVKLEFEFVSSVIKDADPRLIYRGLEAWGKTKKAKKVRALDGDDWRKLVSFVKTLMPHVLFFPNFLFDFPDRIYLEHPPAPVPVHTFYRQVVEDILHTYDPNASLEEHVLSRIRGDASILSYLRESLESVLLKMRSLVSQRVFSEWNRIFGTTAVDKEIVFEPFKEPIEVNGEKAERIYLQVRLKEGSEYSKISERSLGFRWFFVFLLLTQFRGFRGGTERNNLLFLFDEPASNLHSAAQALLLKNFGQFPDNATLIYATHSHYLINPDWLEGTYIVKNSAIEGKEADFLHAANTKVTLHKYREFVATHPNQTTYFQPILEVLDYSPSKLENVPNVIMLEGKNDFYTFKYICEIVLGGKPSLNLLPGGGAGTLDSPIQLYLAWGRNFVALLDSDEAGAKEKQRYQEKFGGLVTGRIFTLADVNTSWDKLGLESLFTDKERLRIQNSAYPGASKLNKTHFNRAIQEAYLTRKDLEITQTTVNKFQKIIDFLEKSLKANESVQPVVKGRKRK